MDNPAEGGVMPAPTPIRVLIVDDHAVVRSGLAKFLLVSQGLELIGEAADGAEAVQLVALYQPDVVLMDLMMPGIDGVTATRAIRQKNPHTQVVALTSFSEEAMVQGALQAGAAGFLQKNVTAAELAAAIRSAHAGRMTLSSEAARVLAQSANQAPSAADALTEREAEVLTLMAAGLNNQAIAERLVISLGTVKFHVSNIYQKLGVDSRVMAVKLALERKLVSA
jgi:two-component system, NarL family, response regulator LiaR